MLSALAVYLCVCKCVYVHMYSPCVGLELEEKNKNCLGQTLKSVFSSFTRGVYSHEWELQCGTPVCFFLSQATLAIRDLSVNGDLNMLWKINTLSAGQSALQKNLQITKKQPTKQKPQTPLEKEWARKRLCWNGLMPFRFSDRISNKEQFMEYIDCIPCIT